MLERTQRILGWAMFVGIAVNGALTIGYLASGRLWRAGVWALLTAACAAVYRQCAPR